MLQAGEIIHDLEMFKFDRGSKVKPQLEQMTANVYEGTTLFAIQTDFFRLIQLVHQSSRHCTCVYIPLIIRLIVYPVALSEIVIISMTGL